MTSGYRSRRAAAQRLPGRLSLSSLTGTNTPRDRTRNCLAGLNWSRCAADVRIMDYRQNTRPVGRGAPFLRAFTLIEILIVVVILSILAVIVVPQFTDATDNSNDAALRRDLQILRHQIEIYRVKTLVNPDFLGSQWDDLLVNDYIHAIPLNPFNHSSLIDAAAGPNVGWVWRDNGYGVMNLYGTDSTYAEFAE